MITTQERPVETDEMLSVKEVADRLRVSTRWVYRRLKSGELAHFRLAGVIRISAGELQRWLADRHS